MIVGMSVDATVTRLSQFTARVKAAWDDPRLPSLALPVHTVKIGRARHCDCVVNDPTVSRVHAAIRHEDGHWWVRDLRSYNGTCVNGSLIADEVEVHPGDRVSLGAATLRLAPPL
jgi:pSer/pThr/pTyr-binding forkhead associated (FHA) protein